MNLHIAVTLFMCVWLGFALIFGIGFLVQEINKGPFEFVDLAPFLMFVFGYVLATGGFKYESIKARNMLLATLNGTIAE